MIFGGVDLNSTSSAGRFSQRIWPISAERQIGPVAAAYTLAGTVLGKAFQKL